MDEDGDEALLGRVREAHTDWTEFGTLEGSACSNGNPWRRLWKEQCWDIAQRNLRTNSTMDVHELAMYGFCSGNLEAMMPLCSGLWADRVWGELHCLKELLVERLLDAGRGQWCKDSELFLGEGDGGHPDIADTPADREARSAKLCGRWKDVRSEDIDAIVAREVSQLLQRLQEDSTVPRIHEAASRPFARLQASLIEAAWEPDQHRSSLAMLRSWLVDGLDGAPCPFVVKQFASYFAIWQKEAAARREGQPAEMSDGMPPVATSDAQEVDDIVHTLVTDLMDAASSSWIEQCLEGRAVELIAEHVSALSFERRLEAYTSFLLQLGANSNNLRGAPVKEQESESEGQVAIPLELEVEVLKRCLWVFWNRFPHEALALIAALVRRTLHLGESTWIQQHDAEVGPLGVSDEVRPEELCLALHCISAFWFVVRDKAVEGTSVGEAFSGMQVLLRQPPEIKVKSADDFALTVLELILLPLLTDSLLSLAALDSETALNMLPALQGSLLWRDAFSCNTPCAVTLSELEWYLHLWEKSRALTAAQQSLEKQIAGTQGMPAGFGAGGEAEERLRASQEALLDWARERLARDQPLLQPQQDTHTSVLDEQWKNMQRAIACRVLFCLLSIFERTRDFEGGYELVVLVAQSPWLLRLLRPGHARSFLRRFALIPTRMAGVEEGPASILEDWPAQGR